jgi:hypothetical protein
MVANGNNFDCCVDKSDLHYFCRDRCLVFTIMKDCNHYHQRRGLCHGINTVLFVCMLFFSNFFFFVTDGYRFILGDFGVIVITHIFIIHISL